jgi:phosphopantothenoylcysteine decarboxylase
MDKKAKKNILIACTGSVATIKIPNIVQQLKALSEDENFRHTFDVQIIATEKALNFFNAADVPNTQILTDSLEWSTWTKRGDPILHIDLTKWADLFIICPLDANTLAKLATGVCDNLLLCTARAWDLAKPFLFCPAMNTKMWEHPITQPQIDTLKSWGYMEVPCISKKLMCGDSGMGAMAEVDTIVLAISRTLDGDNFVL